LGKEFATIYLNEASQIPWSSRNLAVTRLAQKCDYILEGKPATLVNKMFYDCNPPARTHWLYRVFHQGMDPETLKPLLNNEDYAHYRINPRDNLANISENYIRELEGMSLRIRQRFLEGEYGDAAAGALWNAEIIDQWREDTLPDMVRIVVAIDPSGASDQDNAHNDAIGIIVAGLGVDGNAYCLEDCTVKAGPKTWGNVATNAYDRHNADRIIGETNYGGDMVRFVVQAAKPNVPFRKITATRGKAVRAEPIAALAEKGKVRMGGVFPELEEELCSFTTHGYQGSQSPNRADAFVFAISELFPGIISEAVKAKTKPKPYLPLRGRQAWQS
jgi:phage terminase large subunit-like protein